MIVDKLEHAPQYKNLGERIAKGLEYIQNTDFSAMEAGKYPIQDEDLFAVINEYETKDAKDCVLEAHKKYIDIQYMLTGSELIGTTLLNNQIPSQAYNEKDDYVLFKEESSPVTMNPGMFAIFFPQDLHMPGVKIQGPLKVKKVIVKVRI
jgi:YhcH/YjgK/YiaL family protein